MVLKRLEGHKFSIISPLVSIFIFFILFILFKIDLTVFYVGASLSLIYVLFTVAYILVFNRKDAKRIEVLENEKFELHKLLEEKNEKQNDLEEYFLLWMHQMKTPITAGKLLLENSDTKDADELKNQFLKVENYASMAMNYIKITNPDRDMDFAWVNLHKIIALILQKYRIQFTSKSITLHYDRIDEEVLTDPKLASIIIEQIISNALKYTDRGDIWIIYDKDKKELSIKDNGIGILAENIDKIFDKGYSGFNGRLNEKSSGIGLFLAKEISKRLNHKIYVNSIINEGSEFIIKF